jgi:predicted TIM-barrel fold metal-dependent hydrolase
MNRREFVRAAAALPLLAQDSGWGARVLDIHLHPRRDPDKETGHLEGSGVTKAVLLPELGLDERARSLVAKYPERFARFTNADVRSPDAVSQLTAAVKGGAIGFGELKYTVALDSPEMKRIYSLAADLNVPVLLHFQEDGGFNSGIARLPAILKAYSKTIFIAHANSWWANISAEVDDKVAYPPGKVKPGGLSDNILADFPNIHGDLSANSGRNAMQRDPEFAAAFIVRHKSKLIFGSDCGCRDGHGKDQPQPTPAGKCVARETLATLKKLASPELFRRITQENGAKLLKIDV